MQYRRYVYGVALLFGTVLVLIGLQQVTSPPTQDTGTPPANASSVWGAMYFPTGAYNTWQIWAEYNRSVIERDLRYAEQLNLNAIRVFASYAYWRNNPAQFEQRFEHFLTTADRYDIRVLPVLFESIGAEPAQDQLTDDSVQTAFAVRSPSTMQTMLHAWLPVPDGMVARSPRDFTAYMAQRYGTDERVLAVEIMNEPGMRQPDRGFAVTMLRAARSAAPNATLTMGSRELRFNTKYTPPLDVYQVHHNLPPNRENMQTVLDQAANLSQRTGKPVWLTEWQRLRHPAPPAEDFPTVAPGYPQKMLPNYESLAPLLRNSSIDGAFLWGLMLKPAYICNPRTQGRINGIFYPDGTVYDRDDAAAVAGTEQFNAAEQRMLPRNMNRFRQHPGRYCRGR